MKFGFAWVPESEVFDSDVHFREDEKVLKLKIFHEEGKPAIAQVLVHNGSKRQDGERALLSYGGKLIFQGHLIDEPVPVQEGKRFLILSAGPQDAEQQTLACLEKLEKEFPLDPLFHENITSGRRGAILDHHPYLIHWDRLSGKGKLTNLFQGSPMDLTDVIFPSTLATRQIGSCLRRVQVKIIFDWLQQCEGTQDLTPWLLDQLKSPYLSTLSGENLEKFWFEKDHRVPGRQYWVAESKLTKVDGPRTTPKKSMPYLEGGFAHGKYRKVSFQHSWYRPYLKIGWQYTQKRREIVHFSINNKAYSQGNKQLIFHFKDLVGANHVWRPRHTYSYNFRAIFAGNVYRCLKTHTAKDYFEKSLWQFVCKDSQIQGQSQRATFYNTDRGQVIVDQIRKIAKNHLLAGSRVIEVSAQLSFEKATEITPDHFVQLRYPQYISGKVKRITLYADGDGKQYGSIVLGVLRNVEESDLIKGVQNTEELLEDYVENGYLTSDSSEVFGLQGFEYPSHIQGEDLIRDIEIINSFPDQENKLILAQYPQKKSLGKILGENATQVRIHLNPLGTGTILQHQVTLGDLTLGGSNDSH